MNKLLRLAAALVAVTASTQALATPSTVFWTPATTYVQPFLVPHFGVDAYFGDSSAYPLDIGLTMGVLPFEKVQAEVGIDAWMPYAHTPVLASPAGPLMFNAKIGLVDGAFGDWFPGITAGIYGVGLTKGTTWDILHGEVGKAFFFGTLTAGGYYAAGGDDAIWTGSSGLSRAGFMASYVSPDLSLGLKTLEKLNFFADVMTGKNALGGIGGGVGIYFTPWLDILTGPVYFFDGTTQPGGSSLMWSIQLDIDLDFGPAPKAAPAAEAPKA